MVKVITYGTYDYLHYGHIRLLERAKALGDYLIVGVTGDDFDKARGKINVHQSLMERIDAVQKTGLADEIIVEEYEGQKIDDIQRLGVDIFTVGSDWKGKFDYLSKYCKVVYLDRTEGISSSELRKEKDSISIGIVGESNLVNKFAAECKYINGAIISGIYSLNTSKLDEKLCKEIKLFDSYKDLLAVSDAVYISSHPSKHFDQIYEAIHKGKHVLCESPICLKVSECKKIFELAKEKNVMVSEAIKTAYSTAYERLLLLLKSGIIGDIVSVDAVCTSLRFNHSENLGETWNSISAWAPTAMLPIFQLLGIDYLSKNIVSKTIPNNRKFDIFSKIDFLYKNAVASLKIGEGVKSEGELIISGTKGYAFVPAPWWKTDYFEIRFENNENNKRYFYQLDGEGIRYEIRAFIDAIKIMSDKRLIDRSITESITKVIEDFETGINVKYI